jgi:phage gp29-like protein
MAADNQKPNLDEIASAATDFDIFQGFLTTIGNPDKVLALECGGDIRVYDDIGRDSRVAASLRTRALAVIGKEWTVTPFSQEPADIRAAEYVEKVFLGFPFDRARRSLLRGGTLKGFSVSEVMWDYSEGDTFLRDMRYRHQRRFRFDVDSNLYLLSRDNPLGENVSVREGLPLRKFQVVTFGDEVETPYGTGLGRELYWPWWFKKNGLRFWLMFCDKFAAPTAVGEYPSGTLPDQQRELLSAAQAIHSNSAIVFPQGMNLRLIEAARSGSITTYRELVDYLNDEMTICILGQTATTSGKPGAMGDADEQADVRLDLVKADADALSEALNDREGGVVPWLVDYQFPGLGRYPQIWIDCANEDNKLTLAERDDKLMNAMEKSGHALTRSYYIRTHGLEDDDIVEAPKAPLPTNNPGADGLSFAEGDGSKETDAIDDLVDEALADWEPLMRPVIDPVRKAWEEAEDFDGLLEKLTDILPALDMGKIHESLTMAGFKARAMGDATDEA